MAIFSKRNRSQPTKLQHDDVPKLLRNRILVGFHQLDQQGMIDIHGLMAEVHQKCLFEYGGLCQDPTEMRPHTDPFEALIEHFHFCPVEQFIDFLEMVFHSLSYFAEQQGVDMVNGLFRAEGIGFEFSPYIVTETESEPTPGSLGRGVSREITHPIATKKTDVPIHTSVVMPALTVLGRPLFHTANQELLKAHEHYRNGDYVAAINSAGQAYESVFKIICDQKKWAYQQKSTLKDLVEICKTNGLFESFYVEPLKGPGMIRNNLGSHGQGAKIITVKPEQAENMIHMVSGNVLLLIGLAGI